MRRLEDGDTGNDDRPLRGGWCTRRGCATSAMAHSCKGASGHGTADQSEQQNFLRRASTSCFGGSGVSLRDQGPRLLLVIACHHMNLEFSGHLVRNQPAARRLSFLICENSERATACAEHAARAGTG